MTNELPSRGVRAFLIGSKGVLATDDHNVKFTLLPREEFASVRQDKPKTLKPSHGHDDSVAVWMVLIEAAPLA
jgi:hypothetical protein